MVPPEVFPTQGEGPWPIITTDPKAPVSGRSPAAAQPVENLSTLFPAEDTAAKSTEAILRAVSDLLDKTSKSSSEHGSAYVFSLACLQPQLEKNSFITGWVKHGSWWKSATAH
ncbi:hypothetical protein D4764_0289860 [Takifugu flavidus]|uniref:Uncharacterized protein n=1 Tax=Takifugu flavidus TaxID=433684 RepID=A0A5C6MG71_9TELE|nr:hypothetical protein D4764_0289860 [Takifugu flavidus]